MKSIHYRVPTISESAEYLYYDPATVTNQDSFIGNGNKMTYIHKDNIDGVNANKCN